MGMLYEYEGWPDVYAELKGLTNLFPNDTVTQIKAEYLEPARKGWHKVRVCWFPHTSNIVTVPENIIYGLKKAGSPIYLDVKYIACNKEHYHHIVLNYDGCGEYGGLLVHESVFEIPKEFPVNLSKALKTETCSLSKKSANEHSMLSSQVVIMGF